MAKIKAAEASGVVLDYMVAMALGGTEPWFDTVNTYWIKIDGKDKALSTKWSDQQNFAPTTLWAHGGPIIAREQISFDNFKGHPCAAFMGTHARYAFRQWAPEGQILIAAMRCYVASKLGEEVEVPDELLES